MSQFSMRLALAAGLLAALAIAPAAVSAQAATQWRAALTGANEVPAVTTTATGTFTGTLDEMAGTLAWTLVVVPAATSITAAHLHTGAAGVNGGVALGLYTPAAGTATVGSLNLSGTANASNLSGTFANNFAGFAEAVKAGTIYANVHTTANAGGEIRAQVTPATAAAPAAPKTGNAGMSGLTSTAAMAALLAVLAAGLVAGGRLAVVRRNR